MEEFPSNNFDLPQEPTPAPKAASKSETDKVEKVVVGRVVKRKKPWGKRLFSAFGGEDGQSVMDFVVFDIGVPAFKDAIMDMFSMGLERRLYGDRATGRSRSRTRNRFDGPINYHDRYSGPLGSSDPRETGRRPRRSAHAMDEIILDSRASANAVLGSMQDRIDRFDVVTVQHLYDMLGIEWNHMDARWGWYDLGDARPTRLRNGQYLLDLPRPEPVD